MPFVGSDFEPYMSSSVLTRIRNQVGLELVQVDIESTIKAERRSDRRDNLGDETVEMFIRRACNIQIAPANVINRLVIDQECAVRVLDCAVGAENSIVGFNDGGADPRSRVHSKFKLALFAVVRRETLEEEGAKAGSGTTAERVEDQESLETGAVICAPSQPTVVVVRQ